MKGLTGRLAKNDPNSNTKAETGIPSQQQPPRIGPPGSWLAVPPINDPQVLQTNNKNGAAHPFWPHLQGINNCT